MTTSFQALQPGRAFLPPLVEVGGHAGDEGSELGMLKDGGLDGYLLYGKIEVAGAARLEEGLPKPRADGPKARQSINVGSRYTALQVASNVLHVFGRLAIDVARQVEVELVLLDFLKANHARIPGHFEASGENVHDFVNVLGTQTVLGTVLHEAAIGIDHEYALARRGALLIDNDKTSGDTRAVEEVRRQAGDDFDVTLAHECTTNDGFGPAPKQNAMWQDAHTFARALERANDMQEIGVVALLGRRCAKGLKTIVRIVQPIDAVAPALVAKGRIGNDIIKGLQRIAIFKFRCCKRVALLDQGCGVIMQNHVHAG